LGPTLVHQAALFFFQVHLSGTAQRFTAPDCVEVRNREAR